MQEDILKGGSDIILFRLEKLREDINETAISHPSSKELLDRITEESKSIYKEWEKISKSWSVLVLHSELDMAGGTLTRMKVAIEIEDLSKAIEELELAIFLLENIVEKEQFSLRNVF
jgi:hypothetical protein